MQIREQIRSQDRSNRSTIADAIDLLCRFAGFADNHQATVQIAPMRLPSTEVVGLVLVDFDDPKRDKAYGVWLPTSARFRGIREGSSQSQSFDIWRLNEAAVDAKAVARLTDGTVLRAVEVLPARLPLKPSECDWRVVHHTISIIGAEDRCYRSLRQGLPPHQQAMVPDLRFLDCGTFSGLTLPPLKVLAGLIRERDWTLKKLSQQKIADALGDFGLRVPKPRRRRGQCQNLA